MPSRRIAAMLVLLAALVALPAPAAALEPKWPDLEAYEATLIACTRAGGWVADDGTCDMVTLADRVPEAPALATSGTLSDDLARPYARRLARAGYLSHELGGSIDERFARIGKGHGRYGENLGYTGGREPMDAVLHIHQMFQAEWSDDGPHWKNLTDERFAKVGIGIWVRHGRVWMALDFHS